MQKWLSSSAEPARTGAGVQVDGFHRRQEAFLWKPRLWLGSSAARIMNLSFNDTLKSGAASFFLFFKNVAVSLPVSTWQRRETALPRMEA